MRVTLLDRNNYHQFQPLLYQVATSQLGIEQHRDVAAQDLPQAPQRRRQAGRGRRRSTRRPCTVTATDGETWTGDAVVLAAGSQPNFFGTPGADRNSFPLYSLNDAQRLRSRIIAVFEDADRDPSLLDRGALNFVVVGGGPTGVETAGALADMIDRTMTVEYRDLAVTAARVHIVDLGHTLLGPFSERAHDYVDEGPAAQGRRAAPGHQGDRGRSRPRDPGRRHRDPDAVRGVGRRHHGSRASPPRPASRRGAAAASTCSPS